MRRPARFGCAATIGSTSAPSYAGAEGQPANGDGPETSAGATAAVATVEVIRASAVVVRQGMPAPCDALGPPRLGDAVRLAARNLPAGTVTFLFTDVEGSTRLLDELGADGYGEELRRHRVILREAFGRHDGVEVGTDGDAFFVAFPTAPGAITAAEEALCGLKGGRIRVRMGVHTGTPLVVDDDYVGIDVHRAARIAACGHGGQI